MDSVCNSLLQRRRRGEAAADAYDGTEIWTQHCVCMWFEVTQSAGAEVPKPQGDTGVLCYVAPDIQKCSCFQHFCDVLTCETFTLNLVYDNICTWQLHALLYGCVRVKGRKGLWSLLCI